MSKLIKDPVSGKYKSALDEKMRIFMSAVAMYSKMNIVLEDACLMHNLAYEVCTNCAKEVDSDNKVVAYISTHYDLVNGDTINSTIDSSFTRKLYDEIMSLAEMLEVVVSNCEQDWNECDYQKKYGFSIKYQEGESDSETINLEIYFSPVRITTALYCHMEQKSTSDSLFRDYVEEYTMAYNSRKICIL